MVPLYTEEILYHFRKNFQPLLPAGNGDPEGCPDCADAVCGLFIQHDRLVFPAQNKGAGAAPIHVDPDICSQIAEKGADFKLCHPQTVFRLPSVSHEYIEITPVGREADSGTGSSSLLLAGWCTFFQNIEKSGNRVTDIG